jgi:hypothetical protein
MHEVLVCLFSFVGGFWGRYLNVTIVQPSQTIGTPLTPQLLCQKFFDEMMCMFVVSQFLDRSNKSC